MNRATSVDAYISAATNWQKELKLLRKVLLSTDLAEDVKWGAPCYTLDGKNVVGIGAFKSYFGLWFYQGVLLKDKEKVLVNAQEGKTKALRQWRMTSEKDIKPEAIRRYVREAIRLVQDGREITADRNMPLVIPPELAKELHKDNLAGSSFKKLRPGLQREYADYIADAKRDETKRRRLVKILPIIDAGIGLNDKYRKKDS